MGKKERIQVIKGIGTDIIEVQRIKENLAKAEFIKRIFTSGEAEYCQKKSKPEIHFAGRFAAKEAILKAIGSGLSGLKWTDIEILPDEKGMPIAYLGIAATTIAERNGINEVLVSISHCEQYAVAYATALQR